MKLEYKIKSIIAALLLLVAGSCDEFLDVNENPNNPEDAPISGLMTNITYQTSLNIYRVGNITSYYVQYLASPNPGGANDTMEPVSQSSTWFNMYNVMTDLTVLMDKSTALGATHYLGAGRILMALNLSMTVDVWGDVPYSEGFNFTTATPGYDNDETLYTTALNLIEDGLADLELATTVSIGEDDFIFEGDIDQWIMFGNMLKARLLIHTKGDAGYNANDVLTAVDNGFTGNGDNAKVDFFEQSFNPWANAAINNENLLLDGWISTQLVEAMDGTSYPTVDPRMKLIMGTTTGGLYVGTDNGAGRGSDPEAGARSTLIPDQFYTTTTSPMLIATYAEQKFIEAEAAFDTDKPRAYAAYLAGITAHMDMLSVDPIEKADYLADPSVSMGSATLTINDIFKEKYIALFLHPETWNDARRFDYQYKDMTLPANLNPDLSSQFIRRFAYPDTEVSRNGKNVPPVTLLDRIWWDQ